MKTTPSTRRAAMPPTRRALAALLVAGLALGVTACGDDDDDSDADAADTTETTESGDAPTDAPVVEVTAEDYAFAGLDDSLAAGTRLTFTNASTAEVHELVAFRLPDTETRSALELVALGEELQSVFQGPPAAVLVAPPASAGFPVVGDGSLDEPGRYLLICAIPTGADPEAYLEAASASQGGPVDVPGGPPHIANGMYAEVDVTG